MSLKVFNHEENVMNRISGIRQSRKNLGNSFSLNIDSIVVKENPLLLQLEKSINHFSDWFLSSAVGRVLRTKLKLRTRLKMIRKRFRQKLD
jgi:hypothetical protein